MSIEPIITEAMETALETLEANGYKSGDIHDNLALALRLLREKSVADVKHSAKRGNVMVLDREQQATVVFKLDQQKIQEKALTELLAEIENVGEQLQAFVRLRRAVANAWEALGLATEGSTNDKKRKKLAAQEKQA